METVHCPSCNSELEPVNFDKADVKGKVVVACLTCSELFQVLPDGRGLIPFNTPDDAAKGSDDRITRTAISETRARTFRNFLDNYSSTVDQAMLGLVTLRSELLANLAQQEGLLDSAIGILTEVAMVPGPSREALTILEQLRDLVSIKPPRMRGVSKG